MRLSVTGSLAVSAASYYFLSQVLVPRHDAVPDCAATAHYRHCATVIRWKGCAPRSAALEVPLRRVLRPCRNSQLIPNADQCLLRATIGQAIPRACGRRSSEGSPGAAWRLGKQRVSPPRPATGIGYPSSCFFSVLLTGTIEDAGEHARMLQDKQGQEGIGTRECCPPRRKA